MNLRKILIPAFLFAAFTNASAQQRTCDMQVTLLEPAPSAVINAFAQYSIKVNIVNNGPDTLLMGDTLYYNKPSQPLFDYDLHVLTQPVNPGSNITLTLETLNNVNTDEIDQVMDYYIFVVSNPANNGRFIDTTNDDNNYDANANVTFRAGQPTGINETKNSKTTLQLFPNPAASELRFKVAANNKPLSAKITDISGRQVLQATFESNSSADRSLDIATLLPGMYMIQVQTEQGRATGKFVKK